MLEVIELKVICKKYGSIVIHREKKLSGDLINSVEVVKDALRKTYKILGHIGNTSPKPFQNLGYIMIY